MQVSYQGKLTLALAPSEPKLREAVPMLNGKGETDGNNPRVS
jgi:hypothetical protein